MMVNISHYSSFLTIFIEAFIIIIDFAIYL